MAMYSAQVITPGGASLSWEGESFVLPQGTVIGLLSGGALETAIGTGNLAAIGSDADPDEAGGGGDGGVGAISN